MKLAEIYEILNEPRKALELVYEGLHLQPFHCLDLIYTQQLYTVIDSRKKRPKDANAPQLEDSANPTSSLFAEGGPTTQKSKGAAIRAQNRLTHAQLRELEVQKEKEVVRGYRRLEELWSKMLQEDEEAEREWLVEAEKLVDTFRETRNLFSTSRVCFLFHKIARYC